MGDYQVLFSGEVSRGSDVNVVRERLARELGIDERRARTLFSGRTLVIRSRLQERDAQLLQHRLADLGAICRLGRTDVQQARDPQIDRDGFRMKSTAERAPRDITAHLECPRCGHSQPEIRLRAVDAAGRPRDVPPKPTNMPC
jgi:hypothetical protein